MAQLGTLVLVGVPVVIFALVTWVNAHKLYEPTSAEVVKAQRRAPPSIWLDGVWVRVDQVTDMQYSAMEHRLYAAHGTWDHRAAAVLDLVAKYRASR